jgi:hypothetical protein
MYHPTGFIDAGNIIIKDKKYAYYNSPGHSYLNKFISALQLEEKFKNDDDYEELCALYSSCIKKENVIVCNPKPFTIHSYEETTYEDKFQKKRKETKKTQKNQKTQKTQKKRKEKMRNMKKNKIRQNGYDDKTYFISQYTLKPMELLDETDFEIEEHYLLNLNVDRYSFDEYDYDSEEERDRREECAIEWFIDAPW